MTDSAPKKPGWVRRLSGYVIAHRTDAILAFGAAVIGSLAQVLAPLVEKHIVDDVIDTHKSALWPSVVVLIFLAAAVFGAGYVRRYRGGRIALEVQYELRNAMQAKLQHLDFKTLDAMPTGQVVGRSNSDTGLVQGLLSFLPIMSGNVLMLLLSLIVMLVLSPLLAVVSLVVAPALFVVSYRMRTRVFPATWDGQQREGDVAQIVDEDVQGVRVVKAFGQERRELERLTESAETLYSAQLRAVRISSRYSPLLQSIPTIGQVAVLGLGGWLTLKGDISLGTFLAFSTYIAQLLAPARQLAGLLAVGQQARAGIERIFDLLDLPADIHDKPDAIELPNSGGSIDFDNVHFSYGGDTETLRGFDLTIAAGERVALVGPSGCGKSTVAMLASRFYEVDSGSVSVDGYDVRDLQLASLRSSIAVAFEESFLFSESVRDNIAYGNPDATFEEIEAAARAAEAHSFITALPEGYDTVVGERGMTLSGGQRQRVALARAILCDPQILILDDATSAVDATTEEAIQGSLRRVLDGRTTLLVAHRRSTLHLADRIVVMDAGRVVDQGDHETLLNRSQLYRQLLSGLDEDLAKEVGDRIELLSSLASSPGGITRSAWKDQDGSTKPGDGGKARKYSGRSMGPGIGAGLGGGGGGWRLGLAPSPELLARVALLPPLKQEITIDVDEESAPQKNFSLGRLMSAFKLPLLFGLFLVILDGLASIAGPILTKHGIDNGVSDHSEAALFGATGIYLVITIADFFDQIGETFVTGRTAQRIMLSLRVRIWGQLQRLSLDYYEREMAGRIMTRMTTDVDQFEQLMENGLLSALVAIVTFVGVGVALFIFNWRLALFTLSVVIPLAAATWLFRQRSAVLYDQARERIAIVNADFQESLSGVRESQAFVHEAKSIERFERLGTNYLEARVGAQRLVATYFPFVQFLSALADVIVLGVGARLIAHGHLTSGTLIAFILYVDLFFSPIQQLSQVFDAWQQTRVSVGRIAELMVQDTLTPEAAAPVSPGRLSGELRLENVRFAYPRIAGRAPEALQGVDINIAAGETVALVGETGAGKSTVMKLLARFYDPDKGAVLLDGHDLRSMPLTEFRSQLGYVPQESFLFSGSIRDNIGFGRPDASDAEIEAAARAVGAHDFIAALPEGYHQELTERGRSLSAGQRQLVALARAELVDPVFLLLDEATSNLDLATEAKVNAAMERLAHGRTTIVIAHRLQTAMTADRIIVMDGGRVAEIGSHDELLESGGKYSDMWRSFELISASAN